VYNREAAAHFPWEETRVGVLAQSTGVVQRLIDKQSVWGLENGLAAIVPEAITVSVRGFAYLMPDMIGGNEYDQDRIEPELLIRWAQASALMPLMQFSKGPWRFGEEAVRLSRDASALHQRFAPYLIKLAHQFPVTGDPILRPLWYNSPEDDGTFKISDQFMIGNDVVVAPVLQKGATRRKLYLPEGRWKEWKSGKIQEGKRWIEVAAPLDTLPLFVRDGSSAAGL
jgi:alpha-glucosidase (family GH31 glycosyl hydrolase)